MNLFLGSMQYKIIIHHHHHYVKAMLFPVTHVSPSIIIVFKSQSNRKFVSFPVHLKNVALARPLGFSSNSFPSRNVTQELILSQYVPAKFCLILLIIFKSGPSSFTSARIAHCFPYLSNSSSPFSSSPTVPSLPASSLLFSRWFTPHTHKLRYFRQMFIRTNYFPP